MTRVLLRQRSSCRLGRRPRRKRKNWGGFDAEKSVPGRRIYRRLGQPGARAQGHSLSLHDIRGRGRCNRKRVTPAFVVWIQAQRQLLDRGNERRKQTGYI